MVRKSKKELFKPATGLKKDLVIPESGETFLRTLRKYNLNASSPRKVSLLSFKHIARRLPFAKEHVEWPLGK